MTHIVEPYYLFKKPQNFSLMILILDPLAIRARIVYVFHHDLISPDKLRFRYSCAMQKLFHRRSRRIVPRPELYRIPPPYQSSCFVAGSTFFRSACAGAGPIFQRIIRISLSRDRICHVMRFSLFLPDWADEYRCRG